MKFKLTYIIIVASFLVSGALIGGLPIADIDISKHKGLKITAEQIDLKKDGMISLDELSFRQQNRFAQLDRNHDGSINFTEFNARIVAMFNRMDSDGNGLPDNTELSNSLPHHKRGYGNKITMPAKPE